MSYAGLPAPDPAQSNPKDLAVQEESGQEPILINRHAIGSSGIKNYAGYTSEDYLSILEGHAAADAYDKMRRSDAKIRQCLNAVKNPIRGAHWSIEPAKKELVANAETHAKFIDHVLLKDMDKPWLQFLTEALSFIDFGNAPFEIVHKVVLDHPEWGSYNGIRTLGWRSPRTIHRWHLNHDTGKLERIAQYAYGDLQRLVDIPAQFLLVFSLEKEGDNYEGISMLRACYGPWFRKDTYLKLMAIGIEKSAVPTPIVTVPEGKENSTQFKNVISMIQNYVSNESNYLTLPAGWKVDFLKNPFDPSKLREAIEFENREMSIAFMANFLELGMGHSSTGSYALSADLSEFFLSGIVHIGEQICGPINSDLIPNLIKMKFGPQKAYPTLKVSGIADRIGKEFAEVMRFLVDTECIRPDDILEADLRTRLRLKPADPKTTRHVKPVTTQGPAT